MSPVPSECVPRPPARHWLSWLIGAALIGAVVLGALHFSEAREFARLADQAQPWWLLAAVGLQLITYPAAGQVYRGVIRAGGGALTVAAATRMTLTKLFVGQAVPSAGLSGLVVLANRLEQAGVPRSVIAAGIVVDLASYYAAYLLSLLLALGVAAQRGEANRLLVGVSLGFFVFALGVGGVLLVLAGATRKRLPLRRRWQRPLRLLIDYIEEADPWLARRPWLLLQGAVCHLSVVFLDAATLWVLIRSLGAQGPAGGVFASLMMASLLRTLGFIPGGLGTFEAASVVTLHLVGVPTAAALAATLLFRGLSFWLPMIPGAWFARRPL